MVRIVSNHPHDELFDMELEKLIELAVKNSTKIENFSLSTVSVDIKPQYREKVGVAKFFLGCPPDDGFYDSYFLFSRIGVAFGRRLLNENTVDTKIYDSLFHLADIWRRHDEEIEKQNREKRGVLRGAQIDILKLAGQDYSLRDIDSAIPLTIYDLVYGVSHSTEIEAMILLAQGYEMERCGQGQPKRKKNRDIKNNNEFLSDVDKSNANVLVTWGHTMYTVNPHRIVLSGPESNAYFIQQHLDEIRKAYTTTREFEFCPGIEDSLRLATCRMRRRMWSAYNVVGGYLSAVSSR